jgi:hypothetical protein
MRTCSVGVLFALCAGVALNWGCCQTHDPASGDARSSGETIPRPADAGAALKRLSEGNLQVTSKSDCVSEIVGRVFISPAGNEITEPKVRTSVESAQAGHENKPVLWLHFKVSVNDLFLRLREKDPTVESIEAEQFTIATGQNTVVPIAHEGIVIVDGYTRHLRQDLVYRLPTHATGLELVIHGVALAKFSP